MGRGTGRAKRPVHPANKSAEQLAAGLRELLYQAGFTYRKLAESAYYHSAVLWRAANGPTVPSWPVTKAFVGACAAKIGREIDIEVWHTLWITAAHNQGER